MATASQRIIQIQFSGDVNASLAFPAQANAASPGAFNSVDLPAGNNTITLLTGTKALTIIPPSTNTFALTIKGIVGDTGIPISKTEPTTLTFDTAVTSFVLTNNGAGAVNGLKLIWS